jgi:hypothetical protein
MKLTTYHHLVTRLRMVELYLHSPVHLHGVVLNQLFPWVTLTLPNIIPTMKPNGMRGAGHIARISEDIMEHVGVDRRTVLK